MVPKSPEEMSKSIVSMTGLLAHRGPDDFGYHIGERVSLGHRRLSIIDLKTGRQPIYNEDRTKCIVFNGEIYNFKDINRDLKEKGHIFSTNSDTETILHAYEEWGTSCLDKFRGMFAFAIWDEPIKTLFLARDRLGKKPLFYAEYGGKFVFASEMKSLLIDQEFRRTLDEEAIASYFTYSYIPAPATVYRGIRKLNPGHYLIYQDGRTTIREYWDLYFAPDRRKKEKDFIPEFMELLEEAVRIRLMSEVPLGAFLSGGIDSSTVVALMSHASVEPVNTFTIGFGGDTGSFQDERVYARLVAGRYRTNHREYEVTPEIDGLVEKIVGAFDEPFADDSTIPSYFVCKMARENVTVALSGLGGDEAFCGYERYLGFQVSHYYNFLPLRIRSLILNHVVDRISEPSSGGYGLNHIKRFMRSAPEEPALRYFGFINKANPRYFKDLFLDMRNTFDDAFAEVRRNYLHSFNSSKAEDDLNKVFYFDVKNYLCEDILACTDRLSMFHSLEVRVPFVDHKLLEYCATIPPELKIKWFRKKYLLRKGVSGLLPKEILDHKKQGFVGPMAKWIHQDMQSIQGRYLASERIEKNGLLNPQAVKGIISDHRTGKELNDTLIWSLIMFQAWSEMYVA